MKHILKEHGCIHERENLFILGRKLLDENKYSEAVKSIYDGVEFWHIEKDSKSDWNHVLYCVQSDEFLATVLMLYSILKNFVEFIFLDFNLSKEEWSKMATGMKLSEYFDLVVLNVTEQCQIELDMSDVPSDNLSSILMKILERILAFESS